MAYAEAAGGEGDGEGKTALANVIWTTAARVASLVKTNKYLSGDVDVLGAALEEALKSAAAETGLN